MEFPDTCCPVSGLAKQYGQALDTVVGFEMVKCVLKAVHTIRMVVQTGKDHRAARAAACCGAESVCKTNTVPGETVKCRCFDHLVAPAAESICAVIIRNDEDNIGPFGGSASIYVEPR
jgi:hypothetical protein